jgi:hypothetical protein
MAGDGSAYAALGLEPGADATAIEKAYKRLIKQHHPDREGGDAARAAEINRAYRELRASRPLADPLELNDHVFFDRRKGRGAVGFALVSAALICALVLVTGPADPLAQRIFAAAGTRLPLGQVPATAATLEAMDQPLHTTTIDAAIGDAVDMSRTRDEMAMAKVSQQCHHALRARPNVKQLDRCAAFDDAVVQLQDRDPFRDRGPFSELTVTGRQWSAASQMSNDYLAIDSRLARISLRVELALAPRSPVEERPTRAD